jgi:hypothetical protein
MASRVYGMLRSEFAEIKGAIVMSHPATNLTEPKIEVASKRSRSRAATAAEIRELKKLFATFMKRLDALLKTEVERIVRQMNVVIEASQKGEAAVQVDFEELRSDLNELSGGMAEQLVRKCGDEKKLERFRRRGWRV